MPARRAFGPGGVQLRVGRPRAGDDRPARRLLEREDRTARATASRGALADAAPGEGLEGPVLRQGRAHLLVLHIVGVLLLEGLELLDQLVLIHFEHVGDHTRGLFEALASVAASALHPLHDIPVVLFHHEEPSPGAAVDRTGWVVTTRSGPATGSPCAPAVVRTRVRMRNSRPPS